MPGLFVEMGVLLFLPVLEFIREKGKATASAVQQSPKTGGSLFR
jgi:hypothetical protein